MSVRDNDVGPGTKWGPHSLDDDVVVVVVDDVAIKRDDDNVDVVVVAIKAGNDYVDGVAVAIKAGWPFKTEKYYNFASLNLPQFT